MIIDVASESGFSGYLKMDCVQVLGFPHHPYPAHPPTGLKPRSSAPGGGRGVPCGISGSRLQVGGGHEAPTEGILFVGHSLFSSFAHPALR